MKPEPRVKIFLYAAFIILSLLSCTKNEERNKELNITYVTTKSVSENTVDNYYIYPNPFCNQLFLSTTSESAEIRIFDETGNFFEISNLESNHMTIDFSKSKSGSFYIEITQNNTIYREQVYNNCE